MSSRPSGIYTFTSSVGAGFTVPAGVLNGMRWKVLFAAATGGYGYSTAPTVTFSTSPITRAAGTVTITPSGLLAPSVPTGTAQSAQQGMFGAAVPWPLNAAHSALLPDGRVLTYGTDQAGNQNGALMYDVWDPSLGTGPGAHLLLPNFTKTDLFCSATSVLWTTGQVLITGGDTTVDGARNYSSNRTSIFTPSDNKLLSNGQMQFPRWYATLVPLPNGQELVLGGRLSPPTTGSGESTASVNPAITPELYTPNVGWKTLTGATAKTSILPLWYYPRAYVTPAGNVFEMDPTGGMFLYTTTGDGTVSMYKNLVPLGDAHLPTVIYGQGKLLSLRVKSTVTVDFNGATPVVATASSIDQLRYDSSGTLLADGTVLVNGGSTVQNQLVGIAYSAQLWSPQTGRWTTGASATRP